MALQERKATCVWEGDLRAGAGRLRVGSGAFPELPVTFSARTEAADGKTSPEELIAAAHATCYAMAFSNTLAQAGKPPERLEVEAVCSLDRVEGGLKITTMRLTVRGRVPGAEAGEFRELAATAEQRCPVSNALRGNVDIQVEASLEGG
jgi:osmotically inducible protein OsmC